MNVRALIQPARPVPTVYRASFLHLYLDMAWFGVLGASAVSFVSVYAARQGADAFQIGLLAAGPAGVNLLLTLPLGRQLEGRAMNRAVLLTAVLQRFGYLLWIPLPLLLGPAGQVWALIGLTLLMSIPGTALAVSFNALFAEAVPAEWRGHVAGIRNALFAVAMIAVSLLCGQVLDRLPFPTGYQVVFAIGFLGAVMSTFHLRFVMPFPHDRPRPPGNRSLGNLASPGTARTFIDGLRPGAGLRFLAGRSKALSLSLAILRPPFVRLLAVLFAFYVTIYLAVPLFPLHWVTELRLADRQIALGSALFYVSVFVGSTQLDRLAQRWGNQRLTAAGGLLMASYPAFMALASGLDLFLVGSVVGGLGWSLVGGALTNYVLEKIPADHRPAHLAWYNLALNAALLIGSLLGPFTAGLLGLATTLLVFAVLRALAALGILLWE